MGSLIDELQHREAAARTEAEELRGRIAQLVERLARVEEQLSRLVIARETIDEVLKSLLIKPLAGWGRVVRLTSVLAEAARFRTW
jgi:chromosome segregation ATPase